jgi:CheY-like chemotaxis protein
MPGGGTISIRADVRQIAADPELSPGDYVVIHVNDTGSGMTPEVARRAFEPFFTTKGAGKGTGLGLSQVYAMARQSGGTVRVDTRLGKGTTVCLFLRRADEPSRGDEAAPGGALDARAELAPATILIIDDDEDVRRWLVSAVEMLGHRAIEAADGPSGLSALDEGPDLMLVDFAMPGMSGVEVVQAARTIRPELPIVLVTGYADTGAIETVAAPNLVVLRKPFELDELDTVVRRTLMDVAFL